MQTRSPDCVMQALTLAFRSFKAVEMAGAFPRQAAGAATCLSWRVSLGTGGACDQCSGDSLQQCWGMWRTSCCEIIIGQMGRSVTTEQWTAQMSKAMALCEGKFGLQ